MQDSNCQWQGDRELAAALAADSEAAWRHVIEEMVHPLVHGNVRGIAAKLHSFSIPLEAVDGALYETLAADGFRLLKNFRFECRLSSFIYWWVLASAKRLMRETVKKREELVSEESTLDAPIDTGGGYEAAARKEELKSANDLLARLWKENPAQALVLVLRNNLGLSSKTVGAFLGKTVNNVDQSNKRAQEKMRKYRQEAGHA